MKALLIAASACLVCLTLTGILPPHIGYGLIVAACAWFVFLLRQSLAQKQLLKTRRSALQARWAIAVRHLSGLPLPVDTQAILFYTGETIILETEQEQWTIQRTDLHRLLLTTADQVRRVNDQRLCRLLRISDRIFYALREKIGHHDSGIRRAAILMLTFRSQQDEQALWVLVSASRPQTIANLIQASGLRDQCLIQLQKQAGTVKTETTVL